MGGGALRHTLLIAKKHLQKKITEKKNVIKKQPKGMLSRMRLSIIKNVTVNKKFNKKIIGLHT